MEPQDVYYNKAEYVETVRDEDSPTRRDLEKFVI